MHDPEDNANIDTQIVADSFHVVCDASAYDNLILSWDRKLAASGFPAGELSGSRELKRHYGVIDGLLAKVGVSVVEDIVDNAISGVTAPAMVLSPDLRVAGLNERARKAFATEQGRIANLDWLAPGHDAGFRDLLARMKLAEGKSHAVFRADYQNGAAGLVEAYIVEQPTAAGRLLVVRGLNLDWTAKVRLMLRDAFELTDAELSVCELLFEGCTVNEMAVRRNVSSRTIRVQLSAIFAKTEVRNQVDLVRLLAMISARVAEQSDSGIFGWNDPYGRERIFRRPDGRRLAYSWIGDPDGEEVLFLHGFVNGYLYPSAFETTLKSHGIKLLMMSRPAYGNSDADPALSPCDDLVGSIGWLLKSLDLQDIVAFGVQVSAIALAKIACSNSNPFRAIIGSGRFLPYAVQRANRMAVEQRTLQWLVIHAPWAADIVLRNGLRAMRQHGVEWLVERLFKDTPFDRATALEPEIQPLIRNATAFTANQGHQSMTNDIHMRTENMYEFLPRLQIPFLWLHGAVDVYGTPTDGGNFYSKREIDEFLSKSEQITMKRVDGSSDLMLYQRPEFVAKTIAEIVASSRK